MRTSDITYDFDALTYITIMKKVIYLALIAIVLASCEKTPQQKAEELVEETVKKVLFKPDTYDPIETKLDSIVSPYNDPDFYKEVTSFSELLTEVSWCENGIKSAKKDRRDWSTLCCG